MGMVQPSMMAMPLLEGFDGVLVSGCQINDCHYRYGNVHLVARVKGERKPVMRKNIDQDRIRFYLSSKVQKTDFLDEIDDFREELRQKKNADKGGN